MNKDAAEFVAVLARELPDRKTEDITDAARSLMRYSRQHERLQVQNCNVGLFDRDRALETKIEERINATLAGLGLPPAKFGGDPRGYTVKIFLPSGRYNTWGGAEDGWGVPQ